MIMNKTVTLKTTVKIFTLSSLCYACVPVDTNIAEARKFYGLHEEKDRKQIKELVGVDPVRTEWCAAFANAILDLQGIPGSESVSEYPLMARSFINWGDKVEVEDIQRGDIVVFPRGDQGWQGHVGFYVNTQDNKWVVLGGNQDNNVSYGLYDPKKVIAIRRKTVDIPS